MPKVIKLFAAACANSVIFSVNAKAVITKGITPKICHPIKTKIIVNIQ